MYVCMYVYVCMHACMYICMCVYVCIYVCMYVCVCVCMHACMYVYVHVCIFLFVIILDAPLLWSNTTCIGVFLHNYIISTKIPCSIYKFVKLTIIVYNLSKGILFVNFLKFL